MQVPWQVPKFQGHNAANQGDRIRDQLPDGGILMQSQFFTENHYIQKALFVTFI